MSDFVTPSTGPDQWFVATLVLLFAIYYAKQLLERTRTRLREERE
ncbi:hypothetical protein ACFQMA_07185 [Halosimplex aquaticum]|uniref:CcmD family protein n=1 Tax=Halosimplex aquaticum TaxID=3026162 RepID=A0ABD5XYB3_9EURY|nr:hypothetical protein [Halosimplex aquaticum]